ncbi:MAG: hypothetical protein OHK0019_29900 [Saprospiraceae bacterium]
MKQTFLFLIAFACTTNVFAQKEGNVWHFGYGQSLDFNSGAPVPGTQSSMETFEGCTAICDADGNLLFYSNGGGRIPASGQSTGFIWNKNHGVMYDMMGTQGGGFSSTQSSVVVPKPGVPGRYFLFTMEEVEYNAGGAVPGQPQGRGLSYFEIDMSLNGGLGGVVNYTESIYVPTYEGLCAVRQPNGSDYWVIVHNSNGVGSVCFPVTAQGAGSPVFNNHGIEVGSGIEASPNGKKLALLGTEKVVLFDFDATTGLFSNPDTSITGDGQVEFSPNSRRLYRNFFESVYSYDVTAPQPGATEQLVGELPQAQGGQVFASTTRLQLGPDGRIYLVSFYGSEKVFLSAIACPNGQAVLLPNVLELPNSDNIFYGLPNFADHIFAKEDEPLPVNTGDDLLLCPDLVLTLTAGNTPGWQYDWSNGATTPSVQVSMPGIYSVSVTDGCRTGFDTVIVSAVVLSVDAGLDQTICAGDAAQLDGSATDGAIVSWTSATAALSNPNIPNPTTLPMATSDFVMQAELSGCKLRDTMTITVLPPLNGAVAFADTLIEEGESIQLLASGGATYTWSPAEGLSCTDCPNPTASPVDSTVYTVLIKQNGFCNDTLTVTVRVMPPDCSVRVPNAFTPNGDSVNDTFRPLADYDRMELNIYSRWGKLMYRGDAAWDGRSSGEEAASDVYIYLINLNICGEERQLKGDVTLLR